MIRLQNAENNEFALYIPKSRITGTNIRLVISNDFEKIPKTYEVGGANPLTIIQHTDRFVVLQIDLTDDGLYPSGWWSWELFGSNDGLDYTKLNEGRLYVEEGITNKEIDEYVFIGDNDDFQTETFIGVDEGVVAITFWNTADVLWNNANQTWN